MPPRASLKLAAGVVLWLSVVVAATVWMTAYSSTPGNSGKPPTDWPAQSRIPVQAGQPTLVMFAHPRCPCTRASLGELERLMARAPGKFAAHVLFLQPAGTEPGWTQTDLWRKAAAIPGVTVQQDDAGVEARRFHSETSGSVVFYDAGGHLEFQGGITLARGHEGDNPGSEAILASLREPQSVLGATPVFGCSLFKPSPREGGAPCGSQP